MAKEKHQVQAQVRTVVGRKVKNLRKQGFIPATVYGKDMDPLSVQMNYKEIDKLYNQVGESGLVELMIDNKAYPILFRNPQYHPVSDLMLHVDCYKVNLKEKITAMVPLEFVGESLAVKEGNVMV